MEKLTRKNMTQTQNKTSKTPGNGRLSVYRVKTFLAVAIIILVGLQITPFFKIPPVKALEPSETLPVESLQVKNYWTGVGVDPYANTNDGDANYVYTDADSGPEIPDAQWNMQNATLDPPYSKITFGFVAKGHDAVSFNAYHPSYGYVTVRENIPINTETYTTFEYHNDTYSDEFSEYFNTKAILNAVKLRLYSNYLQKINVTYVYIRIGDAAVVSLSALPELNANITVNGAAHTTPYSYEIAEEGQNNFTVTERAGNYSGVDYHFIFWKVNGSRVSDDLWLNITIGDTTTIELEYRKGAYVPNFLDLYFNVGFLVAGIFLMVFSPTWFAWKVRHAGLKVETIERLGICMLLFLVGFGLFVVSLWG